MIQQLLNDEKFTNIQKAQAGLTRLFQHAQNTSSFYRILKNDKSLGVLIPEKMWMSIVEDLEALSSPNYRVRIAQARKDKKQYSSKEIKKQIGI
ncbi:MAG: type II toxin-antitoxin system Phd/YefM family antitoxin [bacterium]|nr:type II toxin-antitoxin system Phd/YefM family antitoxin [bacterium]